MAEDAKDFVKFPRTPHLVWLGNKPPRDDRVLTNVQATEFVSREIVVEEKIDGANLGFSCVGNIINVQSRGAYIDQPSPPQFKPLWGWLEPRRCDLMKALGDKLILFGEWCFAVHSARYNRLPDWFVGFDVYDRQQGGFWSSERRNMFLRSLSLSAVPEIERGHFTLEQLRWLLRSKHSAFGPDAIEGLYLRREISGRLEARAKIVRPDFIQGMDRHWSARPLVKNLVVR